MQNLELWSLVFLLQYLNFENLGQVCGLFKSIYQNFLQLDVQKKKKINEEVDFKRIWSERQPN